MGNNKILEVKDLKVQYKTDMELVKAVNGISFSLNKNETLGLVGETGAGKTTTCRAIIGLIPAPPGEIVSGEIFFEGEDILKKKERDMCKIRGNKITMVFQDPMTSLNPVMTVIDQIMEVVILHNKISKMEAGIRAKKMLELVGIPIERHSEYPHQFSGGMRQRVVIAMALACNPALLIADEPTTALDVTIQAQVIELMKTLKEEYDTSIILVTHDFGVVAEMCDKVAVMYGGEIVEFGNLKQIFDNTMHPYTKGLFRSIPDIDSDVDRLQTIKGYPADPSNLPTGCYFHPRCNQCSDRCIKESPRLIECEPGHIVKCHLYDVGGKENK